MRKRSLGLAAGAAIGIAAGWAATADALGNTQVVGEGPDLVNTAITANPLAGAHVTVSTGEVGVRGMQIALEVTGVDAPAGTRFGAHLHVNPCGSTPAASGGHYQHTGEDGPLARREVWLDFTVDATGTGRSVATRDWQVTNFSNRSVVIHAMTTDHETGVAGGRLVCTDID